MSGLFDQIEEMASELLGQADEGAGDAAGQAQAAEAAQSLKEDVSGADEVPGHDGGSPS